MVSNYRDKPGVFQPHSKPAAGMAANTRPQRSGWQVDLHRVQAIVEDTVLMAGQSKNNGRSHYQIMTL